MASVSDGRVRTRLLAASGLGTLLVSSGIAVATALDRGDGAPASSSAEAASVSVTTTQAPPTVVRAAVSAVGALDPEGDQRENDQQAALAVDGDVATAWSTERYDTFVKQGVGLVLDVGAERRLQRLDLVGGTPGVTAEVRVGAAQDGPFRRVGRPQALREGTTTYRLGGARGRYLVVWITAIPGGGAADVAEVRLRVRRERAPETAVP